MQKIFIVDDGDMDRVLAQTALQDSYEIYPLPSAAKMFKFMEKITPDLILLDVAMPEMGGFETMALLKQNSRFKDIPVIFLTGKNDEATEIRGFELGAIDFINKPFSVPVLAKRIELHLGINQLIRKSQQEVRDIHNATIKVIADMVEFRDKETGGHIGRTQEYLKFLIDELIRMDIYADEIAAWDMNMLLPSAQLHDVGKITISDVILNKPAKLTEEEFAAIKTHCDEGVRIIDQIIAQSNDNGFLHHARRFASSHHEKWDGTGYPKNLCGEDIPLEGRIMAIVDVYDALVSERPYKKPFSHEMAVEIIKKDSLTHFDPNIVSAFLNIADDFQIVSALRKKGEPFKPFQRINDLINYIEANITEEIDYKKAALLAACPINQFQRFFSYITDITLSEYIRRRRLTLSAFELQEGKEKVVDIAIKYGYDSHSSFTRAFREFHGITPTQALEKSAVFHIFPKLSFYTPEMNTDSVKETDSRTAVLGKVDFFPLPPVRIIGKEIEFKQGTNPIYELWRVCVRDKSLSVLESLDPVIDSYIGWIGDYNNVTGHFTYIAGFFMPVGTPVPDGFQAKDLPGCKVGMGWVNGSFENGELFERLHDLTITGIQSYGHIPDYSQGWSAEAFAKDFSIDSTKGTVNYICPVKD